MCGIAGYVGLAPDAADETVLRRMARQLSHRGPDGEGIFVRGRVGLAHRRLAVIDREGGEQPMHSADGRFVLVYNGEVYNYRELRGELSGLGHRFTTRSDTEVVLAAWAQWGSAAFDRFNGMFALAILDTTTGEVTLARDQFGIKPLYLATDGAGRVAFGSEIRPVLAAGVVPRRPDDLTIYRYLCFRVHDDTERTFFDRVTRLLPGQLAVISPRGQVRRDTYTRLRYELEWRAADPQRYDAGARHRVAAATQAAIRRRLVSDMPVGTALSGGLDSSTVVATINRLLGERDTEAGAVGTVQQTFSAVFPGERNDEERYVDAVAAALSGAGATGGAAALAPDAAEGCAPAGPTHHHRLAVHKVYPDPDQFLDDLPDFVRTQEEPVISTGPYAQYCVMRQAGRHVTVLLDGQGADEMLAGYLPYHLVQLRAVRRTRGLLAAAVELVRSTEVLWRLGRFRLADRLRRRRSIPVGGLLASGFLAAHAAERHDVVRDDLKRRLLDDIFRDSLPALLRYEDRNTMRFSVEGRVPFLDPDLLRLLWGLEPRAIIRGGWNKRALRDATAGLLPALIRRRRNKIGFTTPEEAWFARMKQFVYETFCSPSFAARPYFDQAAVTEAFRGYLAGRTSAETMLFWRLLNVELWLREMIDRDPTRPPENTFVSHYPRRPGTHPPAPTKPDWLPNQDKPLVAPDGGWARFPLRVDLVGAGDDIPALAAARAGAFFSNLADAPAEAAALTRGHAGWCLFVSEKVVAVAQGRSFFTWEIHPSWWARRLSRFVVRTPFGIGLGDPTTMQLAIQEVGLPRILVASAVSAAGKAVGRRGLFYRITGPQVAAIDGPTQYSAYPANVSAKLAPADPGGVARQVSAAVRATLPADLSARYRGAVIIDANDLGRTVLGHDTGLPPATLAAAFADNPLGQGREQTPFAVVFGTTGDEHGPAEHGPDEHDPAGRGPAGDRLARDRLAGDGPADLDRAGPGAAPPHDPRRKILLRTRARTSLTSLIRSNAARPR